MHRSALKFEVAHFSMLLRFRFANVLSFREEQDLSFAAASIAGTEGAVVSSPVTKHGVLPVIGIYGANASGKTNVIRALAFMYSAVENSYRRWKPDGGIPRRPFQLSNTARQEASSFAADFMLHGIRHEYGFVVDSNVVQQEWLYVYPNGKRQAWFVRKQGAAMIFSSKMQGENRAIEALTRPNSLFLSTAVQNNHEALTPIYQWFCGQLKYISADRSEFSQHTATLCAEDAFRSVISRILAQADLGIAGINITKKQMREEFKSALRAFLTALDIRESDASDNPEPSDLSVEFLHLSEGEPVVFPIGQESHGTTAFLTLIGPILEALRDGGVIAVDELDAHLHPLLALRIIELFTNSDYNRNGAQLIFTTHDTNLFKALRRDQIWFTEKKSDGSSTLYPLTDFRPRRDENLQSGYLQGRYGAVPFIDAESLWKALELQHAES